MSRFRLVFTNFRHTQVNRSKFIMCDHKRSLTACINESFRFCACFCVSFRLFRNFRRNFTRVLSRCATCSARAFEFSNCAVVNISQEKSDVIQKIAAERRENNAQQVHRNKSHQDVQTNVIAPEVADAAVVDWPAVEFDPAQELEFDEEDRATAACKGVQVAAAARQVAPLREGTGARVQHGDIECIIGVWH